MAMRANILRGQFSLRCLLLVMSLVAIAITVYRRPWEIETSEPHSKDYILTTTLHRSWNGAVVKHGWEKRRHRSKGLTEEVCYDEGEIVCKREYVPANELYREVRIDPATGRSITVVEVETADFLQAGRVKKITHAVGNKTIRTEWRAGDELLESLDWNDDRVTHWNGVPAREALNRLLAEYPAGSQDRAAWEFTNPEKLESCSENLGDGRIRLGWFAKDVNLNERSPQVEPVLSVVVHFGASMPEKDADGNPKNPDQFALAYTLFGMHRFSQLQTHEPFLHFLIWNAQSSDCTLRWRNGAICFLPISSRHLPEDRTGIDLVQFSLGTTQEADWKEAISLPLSGSRTNADYAESLFACTSITVDASQIRAKVRRTGSFIGKLPTPSVHPRRDLLGMFLTFHNYRVEQQGSKLIVSPRGDEIPSRRVSEF